MNRKKQYYFDFKFIEMRVFKIYTEKFEKFIETKSIRNLFLSSDELFSLPAPFMIFYEWIY
jgi:hypothetical protein